MPMLAAAVLAAALAVATPVEGPDSGLPVPRFESLKAAEANGRRGPDFAQPAIYRYQRRGLPLMIVGESGAWRRVRDPDGAESWMHRDLLSPRRRVLVNRAAAEPVPLRTAPRPNAPPAALLAPGVVADLAGCSGPWRRVEAGGKRGWVPATAIWGAPDCAE